ncbi:hypothetical protein HC031_09320 [Planosporangium thailandense]|uniref:Uncharacterized protein n=1 Tax=Planosporangium thailandense TaxID=765197 RepID=A0ABX0XV55_9ACTN|nr:hypothetical protein [Planosporangium thailandense]NJC69913.1 hypothetical protein [Planosporangium thailandense]
MAKHREPDLEPLKRGSKRRDGNNADALRRAGTLPDNPVTSETVDRAIETLAVRMGLPVEVVRAHFDKLREG